MGLLTFWLRWIARTDASLVVLTVMAVTVVLVIPLLALVCVRSFYFRRSIAHGEFIDWTHSSDLRPDSERSGDAEKV
jgi:hypothetical protein